VRSRSSRIGVGGTKFPARARGPTSARSTHSLGRQCYARDVLDVSGVDQQASAARLEHAVDAFLYTPVLSMQASRPASPASRAARVGSAAVVPKIGLLRSPATWLGARTHTTTMSQCSSRPPRRSMSTLSRRLLGGCRRARRRVLCTILLGGLEAPLRGCERAHANFRPNAGVRKLGGIYETSTQRAG
jgi:hypothetical protein